MPWIENKSRRALCLSPDGMSEAGLGPRIPPGGVVEVTKKLQDRLIGPRGGNVWGKSKKPALDSAAASATETEFIADKSLKADIAAKIGGTPAAFETEEG